MASCLPLSFSLFANVFDMSSSTMLESIGVILFGRFAVSDYFSSFILESRDRLIGWLHVQLFLSQVCIVFCGVFCL